MQLLLLEEWVNRVFQDQVKLKLIMKINFLNLVILKFGEDLVFLKVIRSGTAPPRRIAGGG